MGNQEENRTFRALYVLAIFFVVDGHIPLEGELMNFGGLFRYYSFHMILFAFGSGYFFRSGRPFAEALKRDCRHLLLPLYLYNLFYGVLAALLRKGLGMTLGEPLSLYTVLAAPLMDGQHFAYNVGAWFIGALFLMKLFYRCLYALLRRFPVPDITALVLSLAAGSLILSAVRAGRDPGLLLPVYRALILLPGYALGFVYRERLEKLDRCPSAPYLIILVLLRLVYTTAVPENAYLISNLSYFPCGPIALYLGSFLAIAFYLRIARLVSPLLARSRLLLFASRNTFDIMMNHGLGILLLNVLFLFLNKFHLGAAEFSLHQFRTVQGYVYAPHGAPEWAWLYVLGGMAAGLAVAAIRQRLKNKQRISRP